MFELIISDNLLILNHDHLGLLKNNRLVLQTTADLIQRHLLHIDIRLQSFDQSLLQ